MKTRTEEIMEEITKGGLEKEIFKELFRAILDKMEAYRQAAKERKARLDAIHKINYGKDEAIDALSDTNNYEPRRK